MAQMESAKRVIAGLAILTANLERGKDYIDLFVPLVGECIRSVKPSVVSVTDLQSKMKATYGIQMPQNALKLVLNRAEKKGYIRKQERTFVPNFTVLENLDFATRYQDIISQHDAAIIKLVKYSSERFKYTITVAEAEKALLSHIQKRDLEILNCFMSGEMRSELNFDTTPKLDYIVSSFIGECQKSDPEGFIYIDTIVKGHFLSHTLFFPNLGQIKRRFHKTEVYFDTALILRILGYEGEARRDSCRELLELLYREGALSRCFRHTRDEVRNVLNHCRLALQEGCENDSASPTFHHLRKKGFGASEIELELTLLDNRIKNLGIEIVEKPSYTPDVQIDEAKLDEALEQEYWSSTPKQRQHDVDCLSAIYRLRGGR